jgi:hemin uptake protein HemP
MKADSQPVKLHPKQTCSDSYTSRTLDSASLLGAKGEVEIAHQGETYRLRRTRQGKLILTK